jgi:beta-glucosidase
MAGNFLNEHLKERSGGLEPNGMSLPAFRNPDLPIDERIKDLVGQLTLEEKCSLLRYDAPAVERLGIPAYNWWNEALHGVGRAGKATVFPQAIGMAATFNTGLVERVASAISDEARAKHHEAARQGSRQQYQGLTFWTPNINIFRDPRWGRGQETWGEDPNLTGEMGAAFVRGLQGSDPKYLKTAACAKHYAVHSGPERDRHTFDACPPKKDFEETYLPAFKRLVDEGVESVMGAYNRVYGEPCCGSELLLRKILRERWGFKGHVVSDCWAIKDFHLNHKVTGTIEESAALALKNGCDLNCGSVYCDALLDAVSTGLCSEGDVDTALGNLLRTQFKLGMFDPEDQVPYAQIPLSVVDSPAHQGLALETAHESLVLLKNKDNALPLRSTDCYMTVVGPNAASVEALMGNYFGLGTRMTTLLEGIAGAAPSEMRIDFRKGCLLDRNNLNDMDWSTMEASLSDVVIAAMGLDANIEGEEGDAIQSSHRGDREDSALPENQVAYLKALFERKERDQSPCRIIVLLFGGSAISVPEVHEHADAIIHVWYPGQAGGTAIADVLFGKVSPSGRLPVSVPYSITDLPPYEDYAMAGRTYRYMEETKLLYPFGFGLSYTSFSHSQLELSASEIAPDGLLELTVEVINTGKMAGKEVVQCYIERADREDTEPRFTLAAYDKVHLEAGKSAKVQLALNAEVFSRYDESGERVPAPGSWRIHVGGCLPGKRSVDLGAVPPQSATVNVKA